MALGKLLLHGKFFEFAFFRQAIPGDNTAKLSLQNSRHYRVNKKLIDPEKHFKRPEELKRLTISNI